VQHAIQCAVLRCARAAVRVALCATNWAVSSSLPLLLRRPTAPKSRSRGRGRGRGRRYCADAERPPRRAGRVESRRRPCAGRRPLRRLSPCACGQVLVPGAVSDRDRVTTGPSRLITAAVCLRRSALARASWRLAGRRLLGARLAP
jgi:hypothetical protein